GRSRRDIGLDWPAPGAACGATTTGPGLSDPGRCRSPSDIPRSSESSGLLGAVSPGDVFVVGAVGCEAAVEDADEAVAEGSEGLVVAVAVGAVLGVEGLGAG